MTANRKKKNTEEPMEVDQVDENTNTNGGAEAPDQEFLIDGDIDRVSEDEEGGIRMGGVYIPPAPKPACTFDATGPRLIITHIVNENFKSYAGVQTLGPFHKSFTAIIGPNGSGKSNVIDSMLFVFGYRATKIRSKKISVLLHKSSKHQNITSASVAVHFCQIIDGVSRTYYIVVFKHFPVILGLGRAKYIEGSCCKPANCTESVCGSDLNTYKCLCELECVDYYADLFTDSATPKPPLYKVHDGRCLPQPCECPPDGTGPFCGNDSITYFSQCVLRCKDTGTVKLHDGPCEIDDVDGIIQLA